MRNKIEIENSGDASRHSPSSSQRRSTDFCRIEYGKKHLKESHENLQEHQETEQKHREVKQKYQEVKRTVEIANSMRRSNSEQPEYWEKTLNVQKFHLKWLEKWDEILTEQRELNLPPEEHEFLKTQNSICENGIEIAEVRQRWIDMLKLPLTDLGRKNWESVEKVLEMEQKNFDKLCAIPDDKGFATTQTDERNMRMRSSEILKNARCHYLNDSPDIVPAMPKNLVRELEKWGKKLDDLSGIIAGTSDYHSIIKSIKKIKSIEKRKERYNDLLDDNMPLITNKCLILKRKSEPYREILANAYRTMKRKSTILSRKIKAKCL